SQMKPTTSSSFPDSASGISMRCASTPLSDNAVRICSAVVAITGWCRMATLWVPSSRRVNSPSSPEPMITGYGGSTRTSTVTGSVTLRALRTACGECRGARWRLSGFTRRQRDRRSPPRRAVPASRPWMRVFQPRTDVTYNGTGIATVRVDAKRGRTAVERNPIGHQRTILRGRIGTRQQRAHRGATGAAHPFGRVDFQVDHGVSGQGVAYARAGDRAPSEREHPGVLGERRPNHLFLDSPEFLLAVGREQVGDGSTRLRLDRGVSVHECHAQRPGQPPSDSGLARAGQPDQYSLGCHRGYPDARASCSRVAMASRYDAMLFLVSAIESPPNFSSTARASTNATIDSATTPAAGTAQTSER